MSTFRGLRALGNATPELRGALRRLEKGVRESSHLVRRTTNRQATAAAEADNKNVKVGGFLFGLAANRPDSNFMLTRGVQSTLYFATDTFVLSAWTGTEYKTVTLT